MPDTPEPFAALPPLVTCRLCGIRALQTPENFYRRSPEHPFETRCQDCRRRRNAEARRNRRNGVPVRGTTRRFGVEIEFNGDHDEVAMALTARGLRVEDSGRYTHRIQRGEWKIVSDASLSRGWELVSPPLSGAAGLADLKKACEALRAAGASIDRSCGLHVHHEVRDLDTRAFGRLFRLWSLNQPNTDMLVARSRRGVQWALPLTDSDVTRAETLPSMDADTVSRHFAYANRYRSLNVVAFPRYGTVEIRQHQGTLSYQKIAAWVAFGQAFIKLARSNAAVPTERPADTFVLLDELASHGLPATHATYLKARAAHFSGRPVPVAA